MKQLVFTLLLSAAGTIAAGQSIVGRLDKAWAKFESDSQLRHAALSLYVIDAADGRVVFDRNSQLGMAPASTQKIITAATAFELLGPEYRYATSLGYGGTISGGVLKGNLFVTGSGDPTLGSWRYPGTRDSVILKQWAEAIRKKGIRSIDGNIIAADDVFDTQTVPDGWIWEDIGNYYGAGVSGLNWHENQYDLQLRPGKKVGDSVTVLPGSPLTPIYVLFNELSTGPAGSGDNAYIYCPPYSVTAFARGTIPLGEDPFTISGSIPMPSLETGTILGGFLEHSGIKVHGDWTKTTLTCRANREICPKPEHLLFTHYSPALDSVVYWFLQKSINLYGEALLKTLAAQKTGRGVTDTAILLVKNFWRQQGLDPTELNIMDGSGLSPQNRVTTHAQVEVLRYAKSRRWFPAFYEALPQFNGMKMKSGSIRDVRGYCGYQRSADGHEYIFSFLVNNYSGRSSAIVSKMYQVLDELK